MLIIPAIDLRAGKCVRLVEGRLDRETVYSDDPVAMARLWEAMGAPWLHVVDLDGAFTGSPKNWEIIRGILGAVRIPVQVGGGIREMAVIEKLLEMGASRVILGTVAIINPGLVAEACARYGECIVVGIDAKNGKVAIEGWGVTAEKKALDLALEMKDLGVKRLVFTDIWRDGTLKGPNLAAIEEVARVTNLKIIASGGVSSLHDLHQLKALEPLGVEAIIVGKALYTGAINLQEALTLFKEKAEEKVC
ncbi:1-(5-phosphoribosyl)-5-[(5-phosphoribosylamino)methylideneamino]imidazole-4-carboxamide isomerase [Desulfovirgula thermocuniculi]|uniref:1-(5-phosphoribosyl)-5-[(5- phosphoribosylamino)methylideneamino]imidazole-4- carboxamide isomerase n=1 Tax=Desulfovirgula thermocuniculi TaxID=348842 RepID=UPI00040D3240|nr:1-(5-phosphoribosyl)-5-[(5-phosphoribosylamino)methylideneamino]imidazole-4-carboxamide isomerase [Desulfovirgula thermocuniculi]